MIMKAAEEIQSATAILKNIQTLLPAPVLDQSAICKELQEVKDKIDGIAQNCNTTQSHAVAEILNEIKDHKNLIKETRAEMQNLNNDINKLNDTFSIGSQNNVGTYAEITARKITRPHSLNNNPCLHSIIVSSQDNKDTSNNVIDKIRTAIDAKTTGIRVDRIRKAKDQKVILGCNTKAEIQNIADKLKTKDHGLQIEIAKNKDPLIIIKDILSFHSDENIVAALRNQNKHLLQHLSDDLIRIQMRYRKKTRNPHTAHVVLQVSPEIWQKFTEAGRVHIDLQRLRVEDQSPLVQCSRCLGYGHSRKFCKETEDVCAHCGGHHMRSQCSVWKAQEAPACYNCMQAKCEKTNHNAFDESCPIRRKWDALARSCVAYC